MAKRGRPRKIVVATSSGSGGSKTSVGGLGKKGSVGSDLNFISDAGLVVPSTDSQGVLEVQSNPKRWGQEEEVLIDNEVGVDPLLDPPYLRALTGADDLGRLDDDGLVVNALAGNRDMLDIRKVWRPKEVSQGGVSERMKSCEAILDKGKAIVQDRVMGASLNEGDWKTVSGKAPKGAEFVRFFSHQLGTEGKRGGSLNDDFIALGPRISVEHRRLLATDFSPQDVKEALWKLNDDKSPGVGKSLDTRLALRIICCVVAVNIGPGGDWFLLFWLSAALPLGGLWVSPLLLQMSSELNVGGLWEFQGDGGGSIRLFDLLFATIIDIQTGLGYITV
ncbi:hypothetical protein Dimus_006703 [Dionaea muscipula]